MEVSKRAQKVGDQIQRELATLIQLELNDPRVGMVSITGVEVSSDFGFAKVYVTVLNTLTEDSEINSSTLSAPGVLDNLEIEENLKALAKAAGFLRIRNAEHPLDQSAVHPERYSMVEQMAASQNLLVADLIGNQDALQKIQFQEFVSEEVGSYTLNDILEELKKPGRDPRDDHQEVQFSEAVQDMKELQVGMHLQGVVTNVTHFGAFVDIGVHQDGLVHISQMSSQFVRDPLEACAVGQRVEVWVLEVDAQRKRIALSMRNPASKKMDRNQSKPLPKKKNKLAQQPSRQKQSAGMDQLMEKFRSL